ncbi:MULTISPECIES: hypothetical protein [unclassified Nocardioides]|uniref:hypothetical protein n=1 Tax=unclassified Nocardioides TaxID=2615069 RepID=UPI00361D9144
MSGRRLSLPAVLVAGALALAACSADDGGSRSDSADLEVVVDPGSSTQGVPVPERRFFQADSPWNTRVESAEVDPSSGRMIRHARERVGVVQRVGQSTYYPDRRVVNEGLYINTDRWTTPVVAGGLPTKLVCRQLVCGDGERTQILSIPPDVDPDPRYDGWFTVFDVEKPVAYDLWRARREDDGSISYNYMRKWDLNGPGYQAPYQPSARGSGLPLFAGLIRPNELQAGLINHALAISVPGPAQSVFVQPASATDGNGRVSSLPEGARIRLKDDVTIPAPVDPITDKPIRLTSQQQRMADAIVAALRTYGAIVVDRAAVPTLYAQRDVTRSMIFGNELLGLRLEDFEVLELGRKYRFPPEEDRR